MPSKSRRSPAPRALEAKPAPAVTPRAPRRGRPRPPESPVLAPLRDGARGGDPPGRRLHAPPGVAFDEAEDQGPWADEGEGEGEGFDPAIDAVSDAGRPADAEDRDLDERAAPEPAPEGFCEPDDGDADAAADAPAGELDELDGRE